MSLFESCPELCARQGITLRHEVGRLVVLRRLAALARIFVVGMLGTAAHRAFDVLFRRNTCRRYVARLYGRVIDATGMRLEVTGVRETFADDREPVLVVGNHVSWLDVMAYGAVQPVTMVSKREIGDWPVIGMVARAAGTIFNDRMMFRRVDGAQREAAKRLKAGQVVATFPEATTTCGRGMARFFPAMFQAAIDAGVPVQPVAFSFVDRHGRLTTAGAYVGEQPLMDSIMAIVRQRDLVLRVEILPRISAKHVRPIDDRRALCRAAEQSIAGALKELVGDYDAHVRPATCEAKPLRVPRIVDPLDELRSLESRRRKLSA